MGNVQSQSAGLAIGNGQLHNSAGAIRRNTASHTTDLNNTPQNQYSRPRFTSTLDGTSTNSGPSANSPPKKDLTHSLSTRPSASVNISTGRTRLTSATIEIPEIPESSFGADFSNVFSSVLVTDEMPPTTTALETSIVSPDMMTMAAISTSVAATTIQQPEPHTSDLDYFTLPSHSLFPPTTPTVAKFEQTASPPIATPATRQMRPMFSLESDDESRPFSRSSSVDGPIDAEDTMFAGVLGDMNSSEDDLEINLKKNRRTSLFRTLSSKDAFERGLKTKSVFVAGPNLRKDMPARRATTMVCDQSIADFYFSQAGIDAAHASIMTGNRTSRNFDMTSYEAKRLLNLNEIPFDTMEFEQAVSDSSSPAWDNGRGKTSEGFPRIASDLSFLAPSRRRSMAQTPGVATRAQPSLVFPPRASRSAHETRSFGQRGSMESDLADSILLPMPSQMNVELQQETFERAVTPCESRYMQLGGIKFGSLRIMNGSPESSPRSSMMLLNDGPESSDAAHNPTPSCSTPDAAHGDNIGLKLAERRSLTVSELKLTRKDLGLSIEPLTLETPIAAIFTESPTKRPSDIETSEIAEPSFLPTVDLSIDLTFDFGSFSLSRPASPKSDLLTISKPQATDSSLFENDSESEFSPEILHVRPDISAHPTQTTTDTDLLMSTQTISRSTSGTVSSPTSEYSRSTTKRSMTTDSGYGSNMSTRSSQSSVHVKGDRGNIVRSASGSQSRCGSVPSLGPSALEKSQSFASSQKEHCAELDAQFIPSIPHRPTPSQKIPEPRFLPSSMESSPKALVSKHSRSSTSMSPPCVRNTSPVSPKVAHVALLATRNTSIRKPRRQSSHYPASTSISKQTCSPDFRGSAVENEPSGPTLSATGRGGAKLNKFKKLLSGAAFRSSFYLPSKDETSAVIVDNGPSLASPIVSRKARDLKSAELLHPSVKRLIRGQPSKATLQTIMSVGSFENAPTSIDNHVPQQVFTQEIPMENVLSPPQTITCEEQRVTINSDQSYQEAGGKLRKRRSFISDSFGSVLARSKPPKNIMSTNKQTKDKTGVSLSTPASEAPKSPSKRPTRYRTRSFKKEAINNVDLKVDAAAQKLAFDKALADLTEERKRTINPMLGRITDGRPRSSRKRSTTDPTQPGAYMEAAVAETSAPVIAHAQSRSNSVSRTYSCGLFGSETPSPVLPSDVFGCPQGTTTTTTAETPLPIDWAPITPRRRSFISLRLSNFWSDTPPCKSRDGSESPRKKFHSRTSSRDGSQIATLDTPMQTVRPQRIRPVRAYSDTQRRNSGMTAAVPTIARERPSSAVAAFPSIEAQQGVSGTSKPGTRYINTS
ncbi:hypothetical protein HOO65_090257 [Ceratocystis lukuohia]|uniref:Uncharacterized protein n=1 Tax=Ceratocystis lukuohia TaxID=2019550 RepID=A0ABR4M9L8_9PEZI